MSRAKLLKHKVIPTCPRCGATENGFLFYEVANIRDPSDKRLVECGDCHTVMDRDRPIAEGKRLAGQHKEAPHESS